MLDKTKNEEGCKEEGLVVRGSNRWWWLATIGGDGSKGKCC